MASRSNHSSPHAGSAPAIRLRSTGQHQEHGRCFRDARRVELHRSDANLCQRLMIELACVVFSHAGRESISVHAVKQNIELLMNELLYRISARPDQMEPFDR
jgi:hypothetical protein